MKKILGSTLFALSICGFSPSASAGVYADDLGKCLVKSSSPDDQVVLMKWVFVAISSHPSVSPYAKITDADRTSVNKTAGALFERLLTVNCRAETVAALKYEGTASLEQSFSMLGQIAMRGFMTNPNVAQSLAELNSSVSDDKLKALFTEAGISNTNASPK